MLLAMVLILPITINTVAQAEGNSAKLYENVQPYPANANYKFIATNKAGNDNTVHLQVKKKWYKIRTLVTTDKKKRKHTTTWEWKLDKNRKNPKFVKKYTEASIPARFASTCKPKGKQGFKYYTHYHQAIYLNSCTTKKISDILNDYQSIGGAITAITPLLGKAVGAVGVYIGAIAGSMLLEAIVIDKVSKDGKYGMKYEVFGNGRYPIAFVPWRQK